MFEDIFKNKKCNTEKLSAYGFIKKDKKWVYETNIIDDAFILYVSISECGNVDTDLIEIQSRESYVLYKTNASGSYVGKVRTEIEAVLIDIANSCYDLSVFKTHQAKMVTKYALEKYGDKLEFLWPKFPDNAILRRKDTKKWYGAILTVEGSKIGLDTEKTVEIIDLRMKPENRDNILSKKNYYPGWHMNKKSWYTIVLDNGTSDKEIQMGIAQSYELAKK